MKRSGQEAPGIARIVLAYVVVYVVWGSTFFFIEKALRSFSPFVLGSVRFVIASSMLMGYCSLKGYRLFVRSAVKEALFIGFLLLFVDMAAVVWSEQYISSGIVSIFTAATAIWFVVFDRPKWRENFSDPAIVSGLLLGFVGVFMLFAEQIFSGDSPRGDVSEKLPAMVVVILGTMFWTIGSLIAKYGKEKQERAGKADAEDMNGMVKTAWQMASAGAAFTLVALLNGEYRNFRPENVPLADWGAMLYLAVMGSILAFGSYIWLLQHRKVTEVSSHAYINPIIALLLAHFFTGHQVTVLQVLGLMVVLCGVLLMNWNLYRGSGKSKIHKRARRIKKQRSMASKSSIPRIIELSEL